MRLAEAMGLPWQEEFDPDSEDLEGLYSRLVDASLDFLRAGGSVSLVDWSGFTELEREAAAQAGDRVRAVISTLIGLASQGQAASVLSVADGGDAVIAETLDRVINEIEGKT